MVLVLWGMFRWTLLPLELSVILSVLYSFSPDFTFSLLSHALESRTCLLFSLAVAGMSIIPPVNVITYAATHVTCRHLIAEWACSSTLGSPLCLWFRFSEIVCRE